MPTLGEKYGTIQPQQGYRPTISVKSMRWIAGVIIKLLRIHGRSPWSNEFVQAIDPSITAEVPGFESISGEPQIWFRTGHGRLFWRATKSPSLDIDTNKWIAQFAENDVFYDVGANIGLYSIMAAKFMKVRTYAIEIDLMNTRMLYENISMNGCQEKIMVLPIGLDNKSGEETLYLKSMSYGDALHNLRLPNASVTSYSGLQVRVPVFKLDDLVKILGLPSPTKLKIDVDGVDLEVLEGASKALTTVTSLVVEYMPNSETRQKIHHLLGSHRFTFDFESAPFRSGGAVDGFFSKRE